MGMKKNFARANRFYGGVSCGGVSGHRTSWMPSTALWLIGEGDGGGGAREELEIAVDRGRRTYPPSCLARWPGLPFPSTAAFLPTNFTILAQHAWCTLTLGLGTKKSKAIIFVFGSEAMRAAVDPQWSRVLPLRDVNRRLIRGLPGCEMSRFKFRKGCLTFYVYAVRCLGAAGFACADDLRRILEAVVALNDFLDHTTMLALPSQRSITFQNPTAVAH
ncbi:uncharacterized protein LOC141836042 [Curcuma longa]|uniref:uncharacterized protein LOC141836042 n=1 Tax=Curcuma longa TaxID=136217 RepID=UPI003D9F4D3A